jgi:hypothetical protein
MLGILFDCTAIQRHFVVELLQPANQMAGQSL